MNYLPIGAPRWQEPPVPENQLPPPVQKQQVLEGQQVYQGAGGPGANFGYGQSD